MELRIKCAFDIHVGVLLGLTTIIHTMIDLIDSLSKLK